MSSSSSSSSFTPTRRAAARGLNRGGATEGWGSGSMGIEDKVLKLAEKQASKVEEVVVKALGDGMTRVREGIDRGLKRAVKHAGDDPLEALSQPLLVPQPTCMTNLTPTPSRTPAPAVSTDTTLVTSLTMHKEEDDQIWNKRQIGYVLALGTTVALVFMLRPLLPAAYVRWILLLIAAVWGVGSIGLQCGLYGTSRFEKDCSRHVGWLIHGLFSVLVIYSFYLLALRFDDSIASAPSASPMDVQDVTDDNSEFWWAFRFATVGVSVLVGVVYSWIRGCCTGGDRDKYP